MRTATMVTVVTLAFIPSVHADVVVSQEQLRDRRGRLTDWTAVRMDSGRKVLGVRCNGKQVGLGPGSENWYGNGFLLTAVGGVKSSAHPATMSVVERGPEKGVVKVAWDMPGGLVAALLELRSGDDKLLLTVKLPEAKRRSVQLLCYPSSFAGGYRQGRTIRRRHSFTATRDSTLGEKHDLNTTLTEDEPWVLFADDHFDVAHSRGVGPCAALYFPHEVSNATAATGNYACYLTLVPKPDVAALHIVLWDFTGVTNADALEYMRAIELVPAAAR